MSNPNRTLAMMDCYMAVGRDDALVAKVFGCSEAEVKMTLDPFAGIESAEEVYKALGLEIPEGDILADINKRVESYINSL